MIFLKIPTRILPTASHQITLYLRRKMYQLIDNEIKNAKAGKEAYIILKLNSLVDNEIIYKLYQANDAGVKIKTDRKGNMFAYPGCSRIE